MAPYGANASPHTGPRKISLFSALTAAVRYLYSGGVRFMVSNTWQGVLLLCSLRSHLAVLRVLSHPQSSRLTSKYPLLTIKYLGDYVALGLPLATRRSIFVAHFQFLQRTFNQEFLAALDGVHSTVWRKSIGHAIVEVALSLNFVIEHEGDMLLFFSIDGKVVYRLVFVFASGRDFGLPDETLIVVSGVQGVADFDLVKCATKVCCDIQPAHILMAALGAIAEVTKVSTVIGLHQSRQLFGVRARFCYDRFFEIYGTEIPGQGASLIRVPYPEKPMSEIKAGHRRRTLRRRQFKAETRHQVASVIRQYLA